VEIDKERAFVAADIPGLIEGASQGAGLGHEFLRHVDRCRLFVHVVDISGREGRSPVEDIKTINKELEMSNPELMKRPQIIAANKADLLDEDSDLSEFNAFVKENGYDVVMISALENRNIRELLNLVYEKLTKLPPIRIYEAEYVEKEDFEDRTGHEITITNVNGVYVVEGEWLLRLMANINFDDRESLMYFQRILRKSGVIEKLVEKGVKDGDTVSIYDFEFDFIS